MASRILENAFDDVMKSEFIISEDGKSLEIRNAYIFWTNFAGKADQFGSAIKNFNVALSPEAAIILEKTGYRVRKKPVDNRIDEAGNPVECFVYFINVKINFASQWPPTVKLFIDSTDLSRRTQKCLDDSTISELDHVDAERWDVVINGYESRKALGKVTGYLEKLYVIERAQTNFGGVYDDFETPPDDDDANIAQAFGDDRY